MVSTLAAKAVFLSTSLFGILAAASLRAEERIEGHVTNGTTRQPVPRQLVQLLVPRRGMQQIATAMTDASGHFALAHPGNNSEPAPFYLIQAVFQGINYRAPVQFDSRGSATVNLTVYDSTRTSPGLRIRSARLLVRAEGAKARVQELYAVENSGQPPHAYVNPEGTFRFRLGQGAAEPTAAVAGQKNMPIPQAVQDGKLPGEFFINYPLQPGTTVVMVAYDADYGSGQLLLHDQLDYPIEHAELHVFPANLSVDSSIFKSVGTDSVNRVLKLQADDLPAGVALEATLSGEAAPGAQAETVSGEGEIKTLPNSMTRLGVPLLLCFLLVMLWALGVRVAKEWPRWKERRSTSHARKQLEAKAEALLNSLADLDELFAAGKVAEKTYWKERLELKAKLVAILKKSPPTLLDSYASRHIPR